MKVPVQKLEIGKESFHVQRFSPISHFQTNRSLATSASRVGVEAALISRTGTA